LTSEQLEAARAERMRHNGNGTLTLEDSRTWIEETGLCLFLPRRQFSSAVAPSFVEAVAGQRDATPNPPQIATAEELLVRLELDSVAVRLNLLGQPGEQPDFVVAGWVLPYVYALRGDRDWRRTPQLTGSRQVSPLAVQTYKLLEQGDATCSELTHKLGREVTEVAVLRAIAELWQQLRIIPVIDAPGKPARWQLLKHRFQKAIAEGASTSQVTAISVLASIYLQAVIAATMEEVEIFLSPLTARSKVREVLRGLVATRQVHTLTLGHSAHYYVAGTLPEFAITPTIYAGASLPAYMDKDEDDSLELGGLAERFGNSVRVDAGFDDDDDNVFAANSDQQQSVENVAVEAVSAASSFEVDPAFSDDIEAQHTKDSSPLKGFTPPERGKALVDRSQRNRPGSPAMAAEAELQRSTVPSSSFQDRPQRNFSSDRPASGSSNVHRTASSRVPLVAI